MQKKVHKIMKILMAEMKTFTIKVNQDEGLCKSIFLPCVRKSLCEVQMENRITNLKTVRFCDVKVYFLKMCTQILWENDIY